MAFLGFRADQLLRATTPQVEAELATRDLKALSTPQLYAMARNLRRQIQQTAGPVQLTSPVREIPDDEYHDQVQTGKASRLWRALPSGLRFAVNKW